MKNTQWDAQSLGLKTVKDFLRWGLTQWRRYAVSLGQGTEEADVEINTLICHVLYLEPDELSFYEDARLSLMERQTLVDLFAKRLEERIPLAYLIQKIQFCGLPFYVDQRVLIPRSPIAELIENQFSPWIAPEKVHRVLDLCTGSACIAIATYFAFDNIEVDAVDLSLEALAVAQKNCDLHGIEKGVNLIHSDLFNEIRGKKYDIIVSNPPYVSVEDWENLPPEYHYEPKMGFVADNEGLAIVERILKESLHYLNEGGILVVETGLSSDLLSETYPHLPFTWLDFSRGGEGVFILDHAALKDAFSGK